MSFVVISLKLFVACVLRVVLLKIKKREERKVVLLEIVNWDFWADFLKIRI